MLGYAVVLEAILLIVRRFEQHGVRGVAIHTHDFAKDGNKTKQLNTETIVNGEVLVDARVQTGISSHKLEPGKNLYPRRSIAAFCGSFPD